MRGTEQVRFCERCQQNVYNLINFTLKETDPANDAARASQIKILHCPPDQVETPAGAAG